MLIISSIATFIFNKNIVFNALDKVKYKLNNFRNTNRRGLIENEKNSTI